jgi:CheY-like chemotaxis protein
MNKPCILVVEDEALIAANLVQTLTLLGYTVHEPVASGEDAIRVVNAQQPDLVLMDIQLLGPMNGIETAEKIRAIADIPIVYLTAYTDNLRLTQAQLTEPYGYIVKPAHGRELNATLRMALYKHALDRKLKGSEDLFRSLVEASPDAIVLTDLEGRVLMLNQKAEVLVG